MNRSVSISLGGLSFFIEEDAFYELQKYLEEVKASLETGEDDTNEIIRDVEARIAELFKEWLGNYRQVVDIKDIDKVISIMGAPEQYHSEGIEEDSIKTSGTYKEKEDKFYQRQMYRDMDDKMIAGVCSGVAHFFGIQPIWLRLGMILLFIFYGWFLDGLIPAFFFAYIILWIVMPKAVTTSDKLKMKGKPVNFDSIKEYINKDEVSEQAGKIKKNLSKASNGIGDFLETFFKIVAKVTVLFMGIIFVVIAVSFIVSYFVCSFSLSFPGGSSSQYINLVFDSSWQLYLLVILSGIVVLIPSLFLLLIGLRLITKKKIVKITVTAVISLLVTWLISAVVITIMSITLVASHFGDTMEKTSKFVVNTSSDTLNISMNDYDKNSNLLYRKRFGINPDEIKFTKDSIIKKIDRKIKVKQSQDSNFYLEIKTSATGKDEQIAQKNISNIVYTYKVDENNLTLNSYISLPKNAKFRNQRIELTLYVPKGKYIKTRNIKKVSYRENGNINIYYDDEGNSNKIFKFVDNHLRCLTCEDSDSFSDGDDSEESVSIERGNKIKNHGTDSL
ncbi:MAG: PspC domain-containing protein [Flavobacteriaceae bacterium]|jgi:phage shock protein PspC (stress-responsive transcriptional regulator)|nr:PspC domain-containing protein [Flavobacteriaceae bacterium]